MEILKSFICSDIEYKIKYYNVNDSNFFDPHNLAKILGISRARDSIATFDNEERITLNVKTRGGCQNKILLTHLGAYRLILNSRKPIAIPFKKWVCRLVEEHRLQYKEKVDVLQDELGKKDMEIEKYENTLLENQKKFKESEEQCRHLSIYQAYAGTEKRLVYVGKIRDFDKDEGSMLIKVGSTKNISKRLQKLNKNWGSIQFIYVIESDQYREFEEFLQIDTFINEYIYKQPVHNGHYSNNEIFLLKQEQVTKLINLIKNRRHKFQNIKCKVLDHGEEKQHEHLDQIAEIDHMKREPHIYISNQVPKIERNVITEHVYACDIRRENASRLHGPRIQKYSADGKNLIMVFDSFADMSRKTDEMYSQSCVRRAIKQNTVYKNFRWALIDKSLPCGTIQQLPPSIDIDVLRGKGNRMIALLNDTKDKIINVFPDQVSIMEHLAINKNSSIIRQSMSKKQRINGKYYVEKWEDCTESLQNDYLENNLLPQPRVQYNSYLIQQYDVHGNLIKTYHSFDKFCHELMIGTKKGKEILGNPQQKYMEFYWKKVDNDRSVVKLDDKDILVNEGDSATSVSNISSVVGHKCQRYTEDGKLDKTYNSFTDIFRDSGLSESPSVTGMKNAFKNKKLYRGYIWLKLPRQYSDDTVQDINDPIIKDSSHSYTQRSRKILEWKNGEVVKEWDSYNILLRHLKIGRVRLLSFLDKNIEYNESIWTHCV